MSVAVAKTIPVGDVQMYWNDVRLGSPKSQASIRYSIESIQAGLDDPGLNVISRQTKEICEVDIVVADLKLSQMRYTYAQAEGFDSASAILTDNYKASTGTVFRFREEHRLSGTASKQLDRDKWVTGTISIMPPDMSKEYTRATDWTGTSSVGNIARISGGTITDLETVIVEYNATATSSKVATGGEKADFEANLKLVHVLEGGKVLQFYAYRAKKIGPSDIVIAKAAEFAGVPMTFHILADMSKNIGSQLFYWALET